MNKKYRSRSAVKGFRQNEVSLINEKLFAETSSLGALRLRRYNWDI